MRVAQASFEITTDTGIQRRFRFRLKRWRAL